MSRKSTPYERRRVEIARRRARLAEDRKARWRRAVLEVVASDVAEPAAQEQLEEVSP